MKVRTCWSALEMKAELVVKQLNSETGQTLQLLESLSASQLRIAQMYEEYRCKAVELTTATGMSAVQNHRQFMVQLQSLQARVESDIGKTKQYLQVLEQRMLKAETQRMKMQSLLDNDRLAVRNFENRREQRGMDEMGMIQFNHARAA